MKWFYPFVPMCVCAVERCITFVKKCKIYLKKYTKHNSLLTALVLYKNFFKCQCPDLTVEHRKNKENTGRKSTSLLVFESNVQVGQVQRKDTKLSLSPKNRIEIKITQHLWENFKRMPVNFLDPPRTKAENG